MDGRNVAGSVADAYDQPLAELFRTQVRRHCDRPAIAVGDTQLSYRELGALAEQFGRGLLALGSAEGGVVAVTGERGLDACVAMVGAVCAGLGYLPVDPSLPAERVRRMLADCGSPAVIRLPGATTMDGRVLDFADVLDAGRAGADRPMPVPATRAPACVMFTSGTTGRPKAVPMPQRGVARLSIDNGFLDVEPTDRMLHVSSLSFDASLIEMWPALLNGACLVPAASDVLLSSSALHRLLQRERISVLFLTTSIFHHMAGERPGMFAGVRCVLTGGEMLQAEAARRVIEHSRPARLINVYGPTEAVSITTTHEVTDVPQDAVGVSIGVPIADTTVYIVRSDGSLAADGEEGELCIAGGCVATGYLNAPQESAARFVALPVGPDGRSVPVYRTGDIASRRADGVHEFIGRRDDQIKIRGFRIEPGEIRAALTSHPGVADAAVVVHGEGNARVLAAYAATAGRPAPAPTPHELLAFLRDRLPDHLVPATITVLDRFPVTGNGKLDRAALPSPGQARPATAEPRSATESVAETVARTWAAILPSGRAEPDDDFFDAGGNSLLAVQLVAGVQQALGIDDEHNYLLITGLLNEPTMRAFTSAVEDVRRTGGAPAQTPDVQADRWRPDVTRAMPRVTHADPEPNWRNPRHVLLTGASGFLGAHLLRELLDRTDAVIHALVRGRDAAHAHDRLVEAQRRYGIHRPLPEHRVRAVPGDLTEPRLGLREDDWEELAAGADVIHHCGAEVNFLYPYEKLRVANVFGTQEILRLAARRAIPVHHVSSASVVHGMGAAGVRRVTEDTPLDHFGLLAMGYPESKWVAEHVVRGAADTGLPVAIHRPYEISGDAEGSVWNSGSALCELFRIITELGLAPDLDLALNLVPVDYVAAAIVHLALHQPALGQTYHQVNPREGLLGDMVDRLRAHGHRIRTVDYPAWTEALLAHLADRPGHPFSPLTSLFTKRVTPGGITLQELCCARIAPQMDRSRTDADLAGSGLVCPPVDHELLDGHIEYFHGSGFLPRPAAVLVAADHA